MEDDQSSQQRRQDANARSNSSVNWRVKDDGSRMDAPQQARPPRRDYGDQGQQPRGSYQSRRENSGEYRAREPREIPSKPETSRLYVGNLLYTAQSADITTFFVDNGFNVTNVSMSIDPVTGRNQSYCFVDLDSVEEATRAMEQLSGAEVLGRQVRINPGVARKEGQSGPRRGFGSGMGTGDRWREGPSNANPPTPNRLRQRLYIGGLPPIEPQSAVEAEISSLLSRVDPPIPVASVSHLIAPHASKLNEPGDHHYLFVDLKNEADADRAIELLHDSDSPFTEGGRLRVNRARENRDRDRDRGERRQGGGFGGGYGAPRGGDGSGRAFGRSSWRTDGAQ